MLRDGVTQWWWEVARTLPFPRGSGAANSPVPDCTWTEGWRQMEEFGLLGETCIWGFEMELRGRVSDLILDNVSHYPTSFLKTQGIALCLWNQQRIICPVKGYGDPNNNNLYLGDTLLKPVSSLPHVSTSRQGSIPALIYLGLGRGKICGSERRQWGPFAVLCQPQSLLHSSPTPVTPEL